MPRAFRIRQRFTLSENALDNYGEQYRGIVYTVKQWYDHACTHSDMAHDSHGHPGFDGMSTNDCLYDSEFNGSLYDWEMEPVETRQRRTKRS